MPTVLDLLVRNFLAAGQAPAEDGKATYLLSEKNGELLRRRWTDQGPGAQKSIAEDAKKDTTAVYLAWPCQDAEADPTEREEVIFYVDKAGQVAAQKLNLDDGEWEPLDLTSVSNRSVAQNGQLSGALTPDGSFVVFENDAGQFQAILVSTDYTDVQSLGELPVKPRPGTPHQLFFGKDSISLFFVNENNEVKKADLSHEENKWEEKSLSDATFTNQISKIAALPVENTGDFEVYVISGTELVRLGEKGKEEVGSVKDGKYVPPSSAECMLYVNGNINIYNIYYMHMMHRRGMMCRRWC